jgi:hypothetical protein
MILPISTFKVTRITGMTYHTQQKKFFFNGREMGKKEGPTAKYIITSKIKLVLMSHKLPETEGNMLLTKEKDVRTSSGF